MKADPQGYILTVSQLNSYTASVLDNDALLSAISVRGEVSGFKRHSSGHIYFSLKDSSALIRCVMFKQNAWGLDIDVRDGMQVIAQGKAAIYAKDGQYQLYVSHIKKEGEGDLYKRFVMLKTRLAAKGLFDEAHKKPLPLLPRCVGIITSPTGAAIRDIQNVIRRRYPMMDMAVCPSDVQGEGAAAKIARAIRSMDASGIADILIVGRGGGSIEDLWAFNEEEVAQAIYDCYIPVISAVGHETDFTISDFVADMRAPTPSAAAELCVPEYEALVDTVEMYAQSLIRTVNDRLNSERRRVLSLLKSAAMESPRHFADAKRHTLLAAQYAMRMAVCDSLSEARTRVDSAASAIDAMSPDGVLKRGYALLRSGDEYITNTAALKAAGEAEIYMRDGHAHIRVMDTEEDT